MKALSIESFEKAPVFDMNHENPIPDEKFDTLINVLAAPIENFDKGNAGGRHYSSKYWHPAFPSVPGASGIGRRVSDNKLVAFPVRSLKPRFGSMAEQTVADSHTLIELPETVNIFSAVAAASSLSTSVAPLQFSIDTKLEDTVIINGVTGFAGKLAVQVAKSMGIKKIIGTGRNPEGLQRAKELGVTQTISLTDSDESILEQLSNLEISGNLIILDYIWGHPTELLLQTLVPDSLHFERTTTLVAIGAQAGKDIKLPSAALRTSGLTIIGMQTENAVKHFADVQKAVWKLLADGNVKADIEKVSLQDAVTKINWRKPNPGGVRPVIDMSL